MIHLQHLRALLRELGEERAWGQVRSVAAAPVEGPQVGRLGHGSQRPGDKVAVAKWRNLISDGSIHAVAATQRGYHRLKVGQVVVVRAANKLQTLGQVGDDAALQRDITVGRVHRVLMKVARQVARCVDYMR